MGYQSDDGRHEGWAAADFGDGRFSVGAAGGGAMVRRFVPGPLRGQHEGEPSAGVDGRTAIGWRGLCECGWRGALWRRVATPEEHDPDGHQVFDPDPSAYGDPPSFASGVDGLRLVDVEDAIWREWMAHLPPSSLTAVREAAAELRAAQARLDEAILAARRDGCSQADIEREAAGR
jgi:hypothetical protein